MMTNIDTRDICCAAVELSKTSWVCAFAVPGDSQMIVHKITAGDVDRLIGILNSSKAKAEHHLGRPLHIVLCYEVGYDGFWLARLLIARGIRTIVFDPASFLMPRRGRRAKTDRIDAEGMTRTLRVWLSGDREVARDVQIPSVEQEDAKRIERERKYLVEARISIVGRIKGLLALHGIWLTGKRIGKGLRERLDTIRTGDGRPLAPFLRRDIERMLCHYDFVSQQIEEFSPTERMHSLTRADAFRMQKKFSFWRRSARWERRRQLCSLPRSTIAHSRRDGTWHHSSGSHPARTTAAIPIVIEASARPAQSSLGKHWSSWPGSGSATSPTASYHCGGTSDLAEWGCAAVRLASLLSPANWRSPCGASLSKGVIPEGATLKVVMSANELLSLPHLR